MLMKSPFTLFLPLITIPFIHLQMYPSLTKIEVFPFFFLISEFFNVFCFWLSFVSDAAAVCLRFLYSNFQTFHRFLEPNLGIKIS